MAVPVPRTWVAAEFVTATIGNQHWRDVFNFMLEPPRAYAYRGTNQALTDGAWTLIGYGSELYDPYTPAAHDNATNNSRLIAPETGLYQIVLQVRTTTLTSTIIQFQLRKNAAGAVGGGTGIYIQSQNGAGGGEETSLSRTVDYPLNATDYVESFIRVDTGANPDASMISGVDGTSLAFRWASKQ